MFAAAREQYDKVKKRFVLAPDEDQPIYREEMERIRREVMDNEIGLDERRTADLDVDAASPTGVLS